MNAAFPQESLATIRDDARRERLLDMQVRLRPYQRATFVILAVALLAVSSDIGWAWLIPLATAPVGFAVADHFMHRSAHPAVWIAAAWGFLPLLLAGAVAMTGGGGSPALMLFALPAVTLGARFETRGVILGTAYILALMLGCTYGLDPAAAAANDQQVISAAALVLCTVILSGAVVASDRVHRRRSTLDPLTGLFNRSALEQRLGELDGQPGGTAKGNSHALLLCDLDHFKRVNDRLGHATGDTVLREVAYTMRSVLRAGDSIYRVGGEEILVILPGATREDAVGIAERLRRTVAECRPAGVEVTISIGVAVSGLGPLDTDDLVEQADAALYLAKAGGRDRVAVSPN